MIESVAIRGRLDWLLQDESGRVIGRGSARNLVTQIGERMYAERGASIAGAPAAPTGMKLGTGSTSPAKTGTGAALATYLSDSDQAFEGSYPASSVSGASRRISYRSVWGPGKATSANPVTEVALVNETLTDASSVAAATVARALLSGANAIPSKGAGETLTITWYHDLLGA